MSKGCLTWGEFFLLIFLLLILIGFYVLILVIVPMILWDNSPIEWRIALLIFYYLFLVYKL